MKCPIGARQIGKSTLVRLFAEQCQRRLAGINLERYPELNAVFEAMSPQQKGPRARQLEIPASIRRREACATGGEIR